jgi:peptidoglycan/LPS O-acetylase OafA/YrhL
VRILRNKTLLWICFAIVILTPLSRLVTFYLTRHNGFVSFVCNQYTWNCLDGLSCGAAVALRLREYRPEKKTVWLVSSLLVVVAAIIWAVGLPFGILTTQTPVGAALQVVPWHFTFTAMLCIFLLIGTGPWRAFVRISSLRFLGYISYGLYLVHLLVYQGLDHAFAHFSSYSPKNPSFSFLALRVLSAGIISIGLAFLSRKYFEEWFLRLKNRWS